MLVVVAAGAAGLAVHADQPHDVEHRPELWGPADAALQARLPALDERLMELDGRVFDLSLAETDLLGALFDLDTEAALAAADDCDAAAAAVGIAVEDASVVRDSASAGIDWWRLTQLKRDRLSLIDAALASSRALPSAWLSVSTDARLAAGPLAPLAAHDELLTEATNAGRDARWRDALDALDAAAEPLDEVSAAVGRLPGSFDVARLLSLVSAYREYDAALRALYAHIRRTGSQEGPDVAALLGRVEQLQPNVPMDKFALGEVVVGALGQPAIDAVTATEQASADIFDALPGEELETSGDGESDDTAPAGAELDDGVEP